MAQIAQIELFGVWETADFFGVTKQALFNWRKNDPLFPEPVAVLRTGPVWTGAQLREYQSNKIGNVGRLNPTSARRMLELCRRQFEYYAESHEAKVSAGLSPEKVEETLDKAKVNREMVEMIDKVLSGETPEELRDE